LKIAKVRPCGSKGLKKSTTCPDRNWGTEDPVDDVAQRAAEHQSKRHRPGRGP
jgi:hypothetical protein